MKKDFSYGVIVFDKDYKKFLVLEHAAGHLGFPKGHKEREETPEESALRELKEEAGISATLGEKTFTQQYNFTFNGELFDKNVLYFVGQVVSDEEVVVDNTEIKNYFWLTPDEFLEQTNFSSTILLVKEVKNWLDGISPSSYTYV